MSEAHYDKTSCDTRRLPGPTFPPDHDFQPGDFVWGEEGEGCGTGFRYLYLVLPGRNAAVVGERHGPDAIKVTRVPALMQSERRVWLWNGNEGKPTLDPSLHWSGRWHGWLRNGHLQSCP